MTTEIAQQSDKHFYVVGGKGGTGKTSTSCAMAMKFATSGLKTLLVSTDPAHSTSDCFKIDLSGGDVVTVPGFKDMLWALEINPSKSGNTLLEDLNISSDENELTDILKMFDLTDAQSLFEVAPPGIDEALALAKVIQILESDDFKDFERVIFDTAPTGHTLRLLSLPEFLDSFIMKAMRMKLKFGALLSSFKSLFGSKSTKTSKADTLEELKKLVVKVRAFFQDKEKTEFVAVTIPTVMAIEETVKLTEELARYNIAIKTVIINQIISENLACSFCSAQSKAHAAQVKHIKELFHEFSIIEIPYFEKEVVGIESLENLSKFLV